MPTDLELGALSLEQITTTLGLSMNGYLINNSATLYRPGQLGYYWSEDSGGAPSASSLYFNSGFKTMANYFSRASGLSVRCIKN